MVLGCTIEDVLINKKIKGEERNIFQIIEEETVRLDSHWLTYEMKNSEALKEQKNKRNRTIKKMNTISGHAWESDGW